MKPRNNAIKALITLSLALTTACDSSHHSLSQKSPFLSPSDKNIQIDENSDSSAPTFPVNEIKWENPELQELEDQIRDSRIQRLTNKFEELAEERITFKNPILKIKDNGLKEVSLDVIYQNEASKIVFLSPEDHGQDFYLEQDSGFDQKPIRLQGMCMDSADICETLSVEISYVHETTRITEHFLNLEDKTAKEDSPKVIAVNTKAPTLVSDNPAQPNTQNFSESVNINISQISKSPQRLEAPSLPQANNQSDKLPDVDTTVYISDTKDPNGAEEIINQAPQPLAAPTLPDANIVISDSPKLQLEASLPKPSVYTPPQAIGSTESSDVKTADEAEEIEVQVNSPELSQAPDATLNNVTTPASITRPETANAPAMPQVQSQKDQPIDVESTLTAKALELPDPQEDDRPSSLLSIGAGQIIFPDISDLAPTEEELVTEVFNVNSAETITIEISSDIADVENDIEITITQEEETVVIRPQARPSDLTTRSEYASLLSEIQDTIFRQSRGFYSAHAIGGKLKNASRLDENMEGAQVNNVNRDRQYGSGLLNLSLEYASKKLIRSYPNSAICIHDLSAQFGGKLNNEQTALGELSAQDSHRNGLDAEISFPGDADSCEKNKFTSWEDLNTDNDFMEKNWLLIKSLLETQRVHTIFVDKDFTESLCTYVKDTKSLSVIERNEIFKKIHHIEGQEDHYHVRMVCNRQNPGCITQEAFSGSTCN